MGILSRLFGQPRKPSAGTLRPGRGWVIDVVGESHYQPALQRAYARHDGAGHDLKVAAVLRPDNSNIFDSNAVGIEIDGALVGHLPKGLALEYRNAIGDAISTCSAKITGGFILMDGSQAFFGVKLNASWPPKF